MPELSSQEKAQRRQSAALEAAAASRLHPIAAGEIAGLRDEGIEPTADQIVWLDRIARRYDQPRLDAPAAGEPVQAGDGCWLWPLTIQASRWYARAVQWFDGDAELEGLTLAFALAHSRTEGVFEFMPHAGTAQSRIEQWAGQLACTQAELIIAVNRVLHVDEGIPYLDEGESGASVTTDADIVASLCAQCGGSPEQWERMVCRDYIWTQIRAINAQEGAGADGSARPEFESVTRDLGWALLAIRIAHSAAVEAHAGEAVASGA